MAESEFTPIERMTFGNDGSVKVEMGYTPDMLDKIAALASRKFDEELMKRIAPQFGYVKERTCKRLPSDNGEECIVIGHGVEMHFGYWKCSECGCNCFEGARYCMGCGAKAVM